MNAKITWLGHATFLVDTGDHRVLVDPFLDDNPSATVKAADVECDHILVTHGHFDHIADCVPIATRTGATVVANFEICEWLKKQGVSEDKVSPLNVGGRASFAFGRMGATIAHHGSGLPDGSYGGVASGFVMRLGTARVYFAGDTSLFLDMKLIGVRPLELAVLPIGDRFTMGPVDAIEAVKLLSPHRVVPCHYNTWQPIEQDPHDWAGKVTQQTGAYPVVLDPGGSLEL
ncbi:MAG: metal-dependent hydrolase [Planctomycetota bacterium]